jgi:hypothetical protein
MRCLLQKRIAFRPYVEVAPDALSELQDMVNQIELGHATLGAEYNLYVQDYVWVIREVLKTSLAEAFESGDAHHLHNMLAKKPPVDPGNPFMTLIKLLKKAFNARLNESEVLAADLEIRKMQAVWSSILAGVVRDSYKKLVFEEAKQETPANAIVSAITTLVVGLSNVNTIQDITKVLGADAPDLGALLYDLERIKTCLSAENPFSETAHVAAVDPLVNVAEQGLLEKLFGYLGSQDLRATQLGEYLTETPDRCITGDFCEERALGILNLDMSKQILPYHQEVKLILESLHMLRQMDESPSEEGVIVEDLTCVIKEYTLDTGYLYPRTTDHVMALVKISAQLVNGTWNCLVTSVEGDSEDTTQTVAMAKKLFELDLKAASKDAGTFRQPIYWRVK